MNYNKDSIVSLSPGKSYREKIGMYLSADRQEAIDLGIRELIYNAQDEYETIKSKSGFVKVTINSKTGVITVEDNLRGIPVGIREDGINSLTAACLIPHSGAKHEESEQVYFNATGVNGQGMKIVCHTSEWFKIEVQRDEKIHFQSFHETEEGAVPNEDVTVKGKTKTTGTKITYLPSKIVYGAKTRVNIDNLRKVLKDLSLFTKGFKIILVYDGEKEEFISKNGLIDGLIKEQRYHNNAIHHLYSDEECQVELALQWNKKRGDLRSYANNLYVRDGGAFMTGFKSSLTRAINNLSGQKISGEAIRKTLDGFVSVKVQSVQFSNQAKTSLANPEARTATAAAVTEAMRIFAERYPQDFEKIVNVLQKEDRAEDAAERARQQILNATQEVNKARSQKVFDVDKLSDAEVLGEQSFLLLTEGNSAGGAMARVRDTKHFGILRLRGKMINALSNDIEKVLENEEVKLILKAVGINVNNYKQSKLRYGKVAITVDADADGGSIACLIMAFFQRLAPQFLEEGRLYWLHAPLYRVTKGKGVYYFYNDEELQESGIKGSQIRFKGLGEASDADLSIMFSENRRLEQLVWTPEASQRIEELMGSEVSYRREMVFNEIDFENYGEV